MYEENEDHVFRFEWREKDNYTDDGYQYGGFYSRGFHINLTNFGDLRDEYHKFDSVIHPCPNDDNIDIYGDYAGYLFGFPDANRALQWFGLDFLKAIQAEDATYDGSEPDRLMFCRYEASQIASGSSGRQVVFNPDTAVVEHRCTMPCMNIDQLI